MFKLGDLLVNQVVDSSELRIEESDGDFGGAQTDHEAISLLVTIGNTFSLLRDSVNHGTGDTREDDHVLFGVLDVEKLGQLASDRSDRAMGVHNVGSLSQTDVGKVELGRVLRQPDLVSVQDGEGVADHVSETTFAVEVEVGDCTIDDSEESGLVEGSVVTDKFLSLFWRDFSLLQLLGSQSVLSKVWLSHCSVLGSLGVESVDIHTFL